MTVKGHSRWQAFFSRWRADRQAAKHYTARFPSPPRKLTMGLVFALFCAFFGWNEIRRIARKKPLRSLSPSKIASLAIVGFVVMFVLWVLNSVPQANERLFDRLNRFMKEWSFLAYIYALVIPILIWFSDKLQTLSEGEKLRRTQKQRVRLLDGFSPSPETVSLFSNRSIYDAIISTLTRLDQKKGESKIEGNIRFHICLLLCSPALDYPDNPIKPWGEEFRNRLFQFVSHYNIHIDICYLPIAPMLGFNPMEDFLSVLADVIKESPEDFPKKHRMLVERTKSIDDEIRRTAEKEEHARRFNIHQPMLDIPFQIVLVMGDDLEEVVVSFAGREILERGEAQPKGFFSSDPYVVETFHQIYFDYVEKGGRLAFVPPHTQSVIQKHNDCPVHRITNYLGLIPNLDVGEGCFSPALANTPKFTSWVITKVLTKDDNSILDIGSGTGVLALMAQKTVQHLGVSNPRIVAVESDDRSFQTLQKNCPSGSGVKVEKWCLSAKMENGKQVGGCFCEKGEGKKEVENERVGRFKVIIADLPFVDVKESLAEDQRFFDPEHKLHRTLFMAVNKNNWLADDGRLITAFSSLGGPDDILRFERLIAENDLQIVQRIDFHECNYLWIVHVIVKKADFDRDKYWWEKLKARQLACTNEPTGILCPK